MGLIALAACSSRVHDCVGWLYSIVCAWRLERRKDRFLSLHGALIAEPQSRYQWRRSSLRSAVYFYSSAYWGLKTGDIFVFVSLCAIGRAALSSHLCLAIGKGLFLVFTFVAC